MHFILDLADPWAYVLIFALAVGESAAFIGLFVPGEAAMLIGGVLVYQGQASLGWMIASAVVGAIIGDSIGYEIGRHFGRRLMHTSLGKRIGDERWDRAADYLRRRGGRAVFLGRFVGFLRALVPAIAGSAELPYPTFFIFNVAGAAIWGTGLILLGVAAGSSYRVVEKWAGRASLILAGIVALAIAMVFVAHKVRDNSEAIKARVAKILDRPLVARWRARLDRPITFLERRFDPRQRLGLFLTLGLVVTAVGAWIFGSLLQDVVARDELALFDRPAIRFLVDHRDPTMNGLMKAITFAGSTPFVLGFAALIAAFLYLRTKEWLAPLVLSLSITGAIALYDLVKVLVNRPRPSIHPLIHAAGSSFPSGHATAAAAVFATTAYLLTRATSWRAGTVFWTAAVFLSVLVAFSRVYLGVHWPTDAMAGLTLGFLWTAVTVTAVKVLGLSDERRAR